MSDKVSNVEVQTATRAAVLKAIRLAAASDRMTAADARNLAEAYHLMASTTNDTKARQGSATF